MPLGIRARCLAVTYTAGQVESRQGAVCSAVPDIQDSSQGGSPEAGVGSWEGEKRRCS